MPKGGLRPTSDFAVNAADAPRVWEYCRPQTIQVSFAALGDAATWVETQIRGASIAMRGVIGAAIIAAGLVSGSMFGAVGQYQTAQECAPAVATGNRGSCTPNPYYSAPAAASVSAKSTVNATSSGVGNRKSQTNPK